MKRFTFSIPAAIVISILAISTYAQAAVPAGYTQIRATVLRVTKARFPGSKLKLKITNSANPKVLNLRGKTAVVEALTDAGKTHGTVKTRDSANARAIAGRKLLQGDEISAKLYSGKVRGSAWRVSDIHRIAKPTPLAGGHFQVDGGLQLALSIGQSEYESGVPIRVAMTVVNRDAAARTLEFRSGQRFDLLVYTAGKEIWRLSNGMMYTMMISHQTLEPSGTLKLEGVWRQTDSSGKQVEPGIYQMKGILTTSDADRPETSLIHITIK